MKTIPPRELLWIAFCVVCLVVAIIRTVKYGFNEGVAMYCFSGVSLLMYLWRRSLRKSEEQDDGKKHR